MLPCCSSSVFTDSQNKEIRDECIVNQSKIYEGKDEIDYICETLQEEIEKVRELFEIKRKRDMKAARILYI